jgi:SAM-dependent methyltransferase
MTQAAGLIKAVEDTEAPAAAGPACRPDPERAYEAYYSSGHYDRRYPRPNPNVLRLIRRELPDGGHVIDFGCGSGRYVLALRDRAALVAGFDICEAALARFRNAVGGAERGATVGVLGPDAADLDGHVARHGRADLALCLFGVLSHIAGASERRATLQRIAGLLKPGTGRLILSVPNRRRRFLGEQRLQAARRHDDVNYVRKFGDLSVALSYRLFDVESLREELRDAGWVVDSLHAESVVPEFMVANSPVLRCLDRMATPLVPASLGYGILALARPAENAK